MSKVIIREANEKDDLLEIAKCLYLTDPFIYPTAFGDDIECAAYTIRKLMEIENNIFNIKNIIIAICNQQICGVLLYNRTGSVWNSEEIIRILKGNLVDISAFKCVADLYFKEESLPPERNCIEIIACCVLLDFRNRGIGDMLLTWLFENYKNFAFTLDVLSDNKPAINLYQKKGFEVCKQIKGFHSEEAKRPCCYSMVKVRTSCL